MGRTVYVVARDHPELYAYLRDRFTADGELEVEVILDRRLTARRQREIPHAPDRRRADRRSHPHVDTELQFRSHAVITLPDPSTS
jgi:hypothetical protein